MATMTSPVSFTPEALKELRKLLSEQPLDQEQGLRVGVKGGGCSGMNYVLGFDDKQEGDDEFEVEGIRVFVHKAHALYLAGMEIDFKSGLDNRGFSFSNPNAKSTCGCGTSFSV